MIKPSHLWSRPDAFAIMIVAFVMLSRVLTSGPVYFADGPEHMLVIREHTYLLQPPGYWLFNRIAGLFADCESAMLAMNWTFSTLGVFVFYRLSVELFPLAIARVGTALYSVIFFAWFSANVHSTYASQLLFPVLTFYLFTLHKKTGTRRLLFAASLAFALGAGFRPPDGAFLLPMFCYLVIRQSPRKEAGLTFILTAAFCLIWLLPTIDNDSTILQQLTSDANQASFLRTGFSTGAVANAARLLLPLVAAFWQLVPLLWKSARRTERQLLVPLSLWILPGLAFFLLIYIADAPYLDYCIPAIILLAMSAAHYTSARIAISSLAACAIWNTAFYLFFTPQLPLDFSTRIHTAVSVTEVYLGKYTRWAIQHQWEPRLSELVHAQPSQPAK